MTHFLTNATLRTEKSGGQLHWLKPWVDAGEHHPAAEMLHVVLVNAALLFVVLEGFHEKDGKAYCRKDYFDMFAPKCGGCARAILENYISALSSLWHPECFVCRVRPPPPHAPLPVWKGVR